MKPRHAWVRTFGVLVVVIGSIAVGVRWSHSAAVAQTPTIVAPSGCPAVLRPITGLLAQAPALQFESSNGLPPNTIEISSFQWGVGRGIGSPTGGSSDREASAPSVSELTLTRMSDQNDVSLFKAAAAGLPADWTLWIYNSRAKNGARACEKITLSNVLVSAFSVSGGGDRPSESLSLNFSAITMTTYANNSSYTLNVSSVQKALSGAIRPG